MACKVNEQPDCRWDEGREEWMERTGNIVRDRKRQ